MSNGVKGYHTCCDGLITLLTLFWKVLHIWKTEHMFTLKFFLVNILRGCVEVVLVILLYYRFGSMTVRKPLIWKVLCKCCNSVCLAHKYWVFGFWGDWPCLKNPVVVVGSKIAVEVSLCVCLNFCSARWWSNCYQISSPEDPEGDLIVKFFLQDELYTLVKFVLRKCVELDS